MAARRQPRSSQTGDSAHPDADTTNAREPDTSRNTLRFIILGLLGAHSMSGYDIKRAFDRSLATYWNAGNSQIYSTLKVLAAQGMVTSELVLQESRPNRRVYSLTEHGRDELAHWLSEPVPERFTKDEFLTKLFFCGQVSDEVALAHLEQHRETLRDQLAHMEWVLREFGQRSSKRPHLLEYQLLVREYKQVSIQTDLDVTEHAIARIRERCASTAASTDSPAGHQR